MASSTAACWTRTTAPRARGPPSPNSTEADLGTENIRSNPSTSGGRPRRGRGSAAPVRGCWRSSKRVSATSSTAPPSSRPATPPPHPPARRLRAGQVVVLNPAAHALGVGHPALGLRQPVRRASPTPKLGQRQHPPVQRRGCPVPHAQTNLQVRLPDLRRRAWRRSRVRSLRLGLRRGRAVESPQVRRMQCAGCDCGQKCERATGAWDERCGRPRCRALAQPRADVPVRTYVREHQGSPTRASAAPCRATPPPWPPPPPTSSPS
jgi:hypothetical protein